MTETQFAARLHTLLAVPDGVDALGQLHAAAVHELGAAHALTLSIECALEYRRGYGRRPAESVTAWERLRQRAEAVLPATDPTMMAVRAYHARWIRQRCEPGDLTTSVHSRRAELSLRADTPGNWLGVATADLAVALLDRARLGPLDPQLGRHDFAQDLAEAGALIDAELLRRDREHGGHDPFTWHAQRIRAAVSLAGAERAGPQRRRLAGQALALTDTVLRAQWATGHPAGSPATAIPVGMRAGLVHRAVALVLLDRLDEAAREARTCCLLPAVPGRFDRASAWLALARALAGRDPGSAHAAIDRAHAERLARFSPTSLRVIEVQRAGDGLRRSAASGLARPAAAR